MLYDLSEHRHRFAVWAAARASQRGFTTVENLRHALEATDIRSAMSSPKFLQVGSLEFEDLHRSWCSSICSALNQRRTPNVTYGRAAKLVAVYLKARVIMGEGANTPLGHNMHPPIDRILLQKLAVSSRIESPHQTEWRNINWTQLDEPEYYKLIAQLREVLPRDIPFWMLEEHWSPAEYDE